MELKIQKASMNDFENIMQLYDRVIDMTEAEGIPLRWSKGEHPHPDEIRAAIQAEECLISLSESGSLQAAAVVDHAAVKEYEAIPFHVRPEDGPIACLHTLAIDPARRGCGLATAFVREIQDFCRRRGDLAIHLDVIRGNIPAEKLYERCGFEHIQTVSLYYPSIGTETFEMYEYDDGKGEKTS